MLTFDSSGWPWKWHNSGQWVTFSSFPCYIISTPLVLLWISGLLEELQCSSWFGFLIGSSQGLTLLQRNTGKGFTDKVWDHPPVTTNKRTQQQMKQRRLVEISVLLCFLSSTLPSSPIFSFSSSTKISKKIENQQKNLFIWILSKIQSNQMSTNLADCPAMPFVFVCWHIQINIRNTN